MTIIKDKINTGIVDITLSDISDLFTRDSIEFLVLKGPHLARIAYDEPYERSSCDLDILVRPDDFSRACEVLMKNKYEACIKNTRRIRTIEAHYNLSFLGPYHVIVELHRDLAGHYRYPVNMEDIFSRSESLFIGDVNVRCMGINDLLLHLCIHMAKSYFKSIEYKHVQDIALLTRKHNLDWDLFLALAESCGCRCASYYALKAAYIQEDASIPPEVLKSLQPSLPRARWLERWLDPSTFPIYRYTDHSMPQVQIRVALPLMDRFSTWFRVGMWYTYLRFMDILKSRAIE